MNVLHLVAVIGVSAIGLAALAEITFMLCTNARKIAAALLRDAAPDHEGADDLAHPASWGINS